MSATAEQLRAALLAAGMVESYADDVWQTLPDDDPDGEAFVEVCQEARAIARRLRARLKAVAP